MSASDSRKVVIDASAAWTGGGLSRVRELASTFPLLAPAHDYMIIATQQLAENLRGFRGLRLQRVPRAMAPPPLRVFWEHLRLPLLLRKDNVDWIFSPFNVLPSGPGLPPRAQLAVIVSSIAPFSAEITSRVSGYQRARLTALRLLTYRSLDIADKVFLLSNDARRLLGDRVSEEKFVTLPMSPPPPHIMEEARQTQLPADLVKEPFFLVVGDLLPHKGHEDAIRAVARLHQRGVAARLLVVGRPLDRRYYERLRDLSSGLRPGGIIFLGAVQQPFVLALMRASAATVIPSRTENTSRVAIEAMACESPILAADIPNLREECGPAGRYFRVRDDPALANHMAQLLDPDVRTELAAEARKRLQGNDWLSASRRILREMDLLADESPLPG